MATDTLAAVLPLEKVFAFDSDAARADAFALEMSRELGAAVEPARDLSGAAGASDVCVTCTPSRRPVLMRGQVTPPPPRSSMSARSALASACG